MTKEEYKKEYVRMMDSMRDRIIGMSNCDGVKCTVCPFNEKACIPFGGTDGRFLAFEAIEIVEKWSMEHPKVTRADKFNEVFGVDVAKVSRFCPRMIDLISAEECRLYDGHFPERERECSKCVKEFWEAEYVAPDADRSEQHDQ